MQPQLTDLRSTSCQAYSKCGLQSSCSAKLQPNVSAACCQQARRHPRKLFIDRRQHCQLPGMQWPWPAPRLPQMKCTPDAVMVHRKGWRPGPHNTQQSPAAMSSTSHVPMAPINCSPSTRTAGARTLPGWGAKAVAHLQRCAGALLERRPCEVHPVPLPVFAAGVGLQAGSKVPMPWGPPPPITGMPVQVPAGSDSFTCNLHRCLTWEKLPAASVHRAGQGTRQEEQSTPALLLVAGLPLQVPAASSAD